LKNGVRKAFFARNFIREAPLKEGRVRLSTRLSPLGKKGALNGGSYDSMLSGGEKILDRGRTYSGRE